MQEKFYSDISKLGWIVTYTFSIVVNIPDHPVPVLVDGGNNTSKYALIFKVFQIVVIKGNF